MGSADFQRICGCLPHSTKLTTLRLTADKVTGSTVEHMADAMSSVKRLDITGAWTLEAVQCFAEKLKTNKSLESISLFGKLNGVGGAEVAAPFEDVLKRYNYSLEWFWFNTQWWVDTSRIDGYLRRNRRIQRVLGRLPPFCPPEKGYPPLPVRHWPVVLEMANGLPSLMYTLLRRGEVHALLQPVQRGNNGDFRE